MPSRRTLLKGIGAALLAPRLTWAGAGAPDFLSAARKPDGTHVLAGLKTSGDVAFAIPLPDRGHAAAAHPDRPIAVAFARRPGTFTLVLNCVTGEIIARLNSPEGRHFYGHGAFSADGNTFFATENDFESGEGIISVWEARDFTRQGEFSSGGVGPHDIALMPDGETLVIANGGIETHPDSGRAKLNIPMMQPNLSYLGLGGTPLETVEIAPSLHKNSIRHLALRADGLVAFAMQWQGDNAGIVPLLGLHQRGTEARLISAPETEQQQMQGYIGSVAIANGGEIIAVSSPRGGITQMFDLASGAFLSQHNAADVCGIGPMGEGFFYTTGTGATGQLLPHSPRQETRTTLIWDNHLVPIPKPNA